MTRSVIPLLLTMQCLYLILLSFHTSETKCGYRDSVASDRSDGRYMVRPVIHPIRQEGSYNVLKKDHMLPLLLSIRQC